jgi:hypothetical protein
VLGHTAAHTVSSCGPNPAGDTACGTVTVRASGALVTQSTRAVHTQWRAGRQPSGARPAMRFCRRALGGLRGGVGQDLADRGLPVWLGDGEATTDGGVEKFIGVRWAPAIDDVLGELLQFEGKGKVRDHPTGEERRVGVSSPWKGIRGGSVGNTYNTGYVMDRSWCFL